MTEAHTTGIHPVGWMRGADYGLAWEVVTDPLGESAEHSNGTYGHGGAFGTQGWIDPRNNPTSWNGKEMLQTMPPLSYLSYWGEIFEEYVAWLFEE